MNKYGDIIKGLPSRQVKEIIYQSLENVKSQYNQQKLLYNVSEMNTYIVNSSLGQLTQYIDNYLEMQNKPQFEENKDPVRVKELPQPVNKISNVPEMTKEPNKQEELQNKFKQLQSERQYEGFIPMTNQEQAKDAFDTRQFQEVNYGMANMNMNQGVDRELTPPSQLQSEAQMSEEERQKIFQETEQQFQQRINAYSEQQTALANQQFMAEQAMNPGNDPNAIGSGGGLESILKPSIPPKLTKTHKYVAIFSGNRDFKSQPNRFDYSIVLEREITNVKKIKILKLVVPNEIDQRRYIENSSQTHIENLRDYFQNNNYTFEQTVFVDIKNINNLNRDNTPEQYHTVATVFQGQNEIFRGRNTKVYGNASVEAIDYGGGVLERLQQFEIEVRNPVGDIYKNNQLDNFRMVDIMGAVVNDISNPNNSTITQFNTLQIAVDKPFEVNQFFMGDYVRFSNTSIQVAGNDGEIYILNSDGSYTVPQVIIDDDNISPSSYNSYAQTQINATGNYTTTQLQLVMNFFNKRSGYQIVEVYQHLNNISNSFFIQLPSQVVNTGGTYTSIPEYQTDQSLLDAFEILKADGGFNAQVQSDMINLSLQHTIIIELEQETAEIDNSQLQL